MMLVIVNPNTSSRKGKKIFRKLSQYLKFPDGKNPNQLKILMTEKPEEATKIVREELKKGHKEIISVGGDGTNNAIAEALIGTEAILGIIPIGTGNCLAKNLKIPLNWRKSIELLRSNISLKANQIVNIDVGEIKTGSEERYFLANFGLGINGQVIKNIKEDEFSQGKISYFLTILKEIFSFRENYLEIETPNWQFKGKILMIVITNIPTEGIYFKIAPQAKFDDGKLNICLIESLSLSERFIYAIKLLQNQNGAYSLRKVHLQKAEKIKISFLEEQVCHLDGDYTNFDSPTIEIKVLRGALKVISGLKK